ncbi:MAG TPA: histidine--tRNA ligase [Bacteroidia bacterium]
MKPTIPKGTRDFNSVEMARRNYIFDTIKKYFRLYGFEQIETPSMENLSTLTGKYGDEGDQLLYKILNSRIHESKDKEKLLDEFKLSLEKSKNTELLTERALRYDLTVPFARYVVMHQHEITFPFRRFQMQPVWRADKPQKGRYREFYQCDADIIGSNSLVNEVELIQLMDDVYSELKIPVTIKINNRKILAGIAEVIGAPERMLEIIAIIDKLDKVGKDKVREELKEKGILVEPILPSMENLFDFILLNEGTNQEKLELLKAFFGPSEIGKKGIEEVEYILSKTKKSLELDVSLARGLNYYTGTIIEVKANAGTFTPSITGGGRYDDLTGIFGLPNMSGVGISFGIDRIYDVMEELNLFQSDKLNKEHTQVLLMHMGEEEQQHGMQLLFKLRKMGVRAEIYPDVTKKINKQFDYATKKNIPYSIVIGSNEVKNEKYTLKTKEDKFPDLSLGEIIHKISNK